MCLFGDCCLLAKGGAGAQPMVSRAMLTEGISGKEKSAELTKWVFFWEMAIFGT